MSYLKKLGLYGIRSYGDPSTENYEEIHFFKPLTLILGNNGAGKSTIIEALKVITTGSFPPNSQNGKTFIKDPRLMGSRNHESQGSISLIFKAINQKQILVQRLFQVRRDKNDKLTFDSKDATIKVKDKNNDKEISINHKCAEIEKQVPQLLGVSKAVFENVIFCHQDESLWPFGDNSTLKNIFDELFDTKQFTKLQESLQRQQKELKKEFNALQLHNDHFKRRYDEAVSQKQKIAKNAEDLFEETNKLELLREQYKINSEKSENEEEVRKELEDMRSSKRVFEYKVSQMQEGQEEILNKCTSHYFLDESVSDLKIVLSKLKQETNSSIEMQQTLEKNIEEKRKVIDKIKSEVDQLRYNDKNSKQLYLDLKIIKDKLQEIINIEVETEEQLLAQAKQFKDNLEMKYEQNVRLLQQQGSRIDEEEKQADLYIQQQIQTIAAESERKQQFLQKIQSLKQDLMNLQNSQLSFLLEEAQQDHEAAQINCKTFAQEIESLGFSISEVKRDQEEVNKQVSNLHQQNAIRSKQLEYHQMEKTLEGLNQDSIKLKQEFSQLQIQTDITIEKQIQDQKDNIRDQKANGAKGESEVSKIQGKIEHLESIERSLEEKISEIAKIFKENNLLHFIASSDTNADFDSKYLSVKEEIETMKKGITEKETCLMLDRNIISYAEKNKKCKFCKHEVNEETLQQLGKQTNERVSKAEKELQSVQELCENRMEEKKTIKKLKDKYQECQQTKLKSKENQEELRLSKIQLKEKQDKVINFSSYIEKEQEILMNLEYGENIQNQFLKVQRLILDQIKKNQEFLSENPYLLDPDRQVIISAEEADNLHERQQQNQLKLETLQNLVMKENQKQVQYSIRLESCENQKQNILQKLNEEQLNKQSISNQIEESFLKIENYDKTIEELEVKLGRLKDNSEIVKEKRKTLQIQMQKIQQSYDSSKILIDDYLPQFEKLLDSYIFAKNQKGKQKGKMQENQLQLLEEQLANSENFKLDYEKNLEDIIEGIKEQQKEYENLSQGIKYHEIDAEILLIKKELSNIEQQISKKSEILNKIQIQANSLRDQFLQLRTFEERCKHQKIIIEQEYSEAVAKYDQSEETYCRNQVNFEIKNGIHQDISVYLEELEKTLINYHKEKMQQINKCIADTWRKIYQGKDIKKLEIKAEETEGKGKKAYNYRIVMVVSGESEKDVSEIDMKGRCSAGQKVLASIIIRLALAEAFTMNCGILALDEPTTNLDKLHAQKLGEQLCNLIESRRGQDSFQLIIISHDKDFINLMQQKTHCNDFYQIHKENGCSKIMRRTYKNALLNKSD